VVPPSWSEKIRFPGPLAGVHLAGPRMGVTQEEILAFLRDRHAREELVRRQEEDLRFARRVLEEIESALAGIRREVAERLEEWKPFLVELALKVAERVLHTALERGDYDLAPLVSDLLERAKNASTGGGILVTVNPADLSVLVERLSSLGEAGMDPSVRFEASPSVPRGGCRVTTEEGRISFDPQEFFEAVSGAVREELVPDDPSAGPVG